MHSTRFNSTFHRFSKFQQIKEGGPNILGRGPILQNGWIIWSPLLYFNFTSLKGPSPSSFIRFQCIVLDSAALFTTFENFFKLNRGDLISWGQPILQSDWIIWSHLLYFNFKNFKDPKSSSFARFQCIVLDPEHVSPIFKISSN